MPAEAEPEIINIAELYARDPHKLSDSDIDAIIADQRERRKTFNLKGHTGKPKALPKKTKAEEAVAKLDLGGISL